MNEQYGQAEEAYERENAQKQILTSKIADLETQNQGRHEVLKEKKEFLKVAELEPGRLERQIQSIQQAESSMGSDLRSIERSTKHFDLEVEAQNKRRRDAEQLRRTILEKLELNRQTLEEREQDVSAVKTNLDKAKAANHDIMTKKYETNVRKREVDGSLRHATDTVLAAEKEYEILKRQLKKKRSICDSVKILIPSLESQFKDEETTLRAITEEKNSKTKELKRFKMEVDQYLSRFLQLENSEVRKKSDLELAIGEVDTLEASVFHLLSEGKRLGKMLSVLSSQRDIKARETARVEYKEKEVKQQVKIKELIILDLTKRCNEISNRLKEFSALYEVVKNERNKYVNLIQSSVQALAEMREKLRILENEVSG